MDTNHALFRYEEVEIRTATCRGCGTEHECACIDSSGGEYSSIPLCANCLRSLAKLIEGK